MIDGKLQPEDQASLDLIRENKLLAGDEVGRLFPAAENIKAGQEIGLNRLSEACLMKSWLTAAGTALHDCPAGKNVWVKESPR